MATTAGERAGEAARTTVADTSTKTRVARAVVSVAFGRAAGYVAAVSVGLLAESLHSWVAIALAFTAAIAAGVLFDYVVARWQARDVQWAQVMSDPRDGRATRRAARHWAVWHWATDHEHRRPDAR